ncbi:MAG: TetR/AcrR family transcriptional regulator [Mahellales bacterium]|jgi:TetR/AcrR family fatty acid metabolism transcriptional regulator
MAVKEQKKEIIRNAAIEVISKLGFHGATTDRIAQEAKVAVGTIYNYFKNKEDILDYIFEVEYTKRLGFYKEIFNKDIHTIEKLYQILKMHFSEVSRQPSLIKIILYERKSYNSKFNKTSTQRFRGLTGFLKDTVKQGIDKGQLKECDEDIIATALFGAVESIMEKYLVELDSGIHSNILDDAAVQIKDFLLQGLRLR